MRLQKSLQIGALERLLAERDSEPIVGHPCRAWDLPIELVELLHFVGSKERAHARATT